MGNEIKEQVKEEIARLAANIEIIKLLEMPLPSKAIERTKDKQTHKGYDTDGYKSQYCINRFNKILGTEWGMVWEIINQKEGQFSSGKTSWEITVKTGIWILTKENVRWQAGGHVSKTYFDALKGAITNSFKKTASLWGVGHHVYEGELDDDSDPWPEFAAKNLDLAAEYGGGSEPGQTSSSSKNESNGRGNDHQANNQNDQNQGNTPSPPPGPSVGNGKEASIRRRIEAKLNTIFGRDGKAISGWLRANFKTVAILDDLSKLDEEKLNTMMGMVNQKFEVWKAGK